MRVLRHRAGDRIDVIDGVRTLYRCSLTDASPKAALPSSFLARILRWITSSTEDEVRERRVLKRAMMRENSSWRTFTTSSRASCPVAMTQTLPPHSEPSFSVRDWKFSSISVSVPIYCPTSSIIKSRR